MDPDVAETAEKKGRRENDTYLLFAQPECLKLTPRRSRGPRLRPTARLSAPYSPRSLGVAAQANQSCCWWEKSKAPGFRQDHILLTLRFDTSFSPLVDFKAELSSISITGRHFLLNQRSAGRSDCGTSAGSLLSRNSADASGC